MSLDFQYTYDHDFTIASEAVGGTIMVETLEPLYQTSNDNHPTAGEFVVTGDAGAKVNLTAQPDGTSVYIEYDINPVDGVYESNATLLWDNL